MKRTLKDWILAARPWALPASMMPIVVTTVYVYSRQSDYVSISWMVGILSLLGIGFIHTGGNLLSDYHDYTKGVDHPDSFAVKTLVSKQFKPIEILLYGALSLFIGALIGVYLLTQVGITLLYIGLFGLACALTYSFFKFRALGDLLIFLSFGPMAMLGAGFVLTNEIDLKLILLSLPLGFITVGILHANNTRDMVSDTKAGVTTFASVLGLHRSVAYYDLLIYGAYFMIVLLIVLNWIPILAGLLLIPSLLLAKRNINIMKKVRTDLSTINELDGMTAQLQLAFGGLLSVGLIIDKLIHV